MDPHRWYTGTSVLPLVDVDHYAFEGSAGQTVVIRTTNSLFCAVKVLSPEGMEPPTSCEIGIDTYRNEATLETNGTHYLRIGMATGAYGFAFALDGEPPSPFRI